LGLAFSMVGALAVSAFAVAPAAQAAVTHEFLEETSAKISAGVPSGCGTSGPSCVSGPLSEVNALTVDSGHLWVAEKINAGKNAEHTRVDRFNDTTGEFLPPQLDEEALTAEAGLVDHLEFGVAVGHAGAEEQVYVGAGREHEGQTQNLVAVFGPSGKLQPEGVWTSANTPAGSFEEITGVAVDGSPNLQTHGDVYVADRSVVNVFAGEAGGKEPVLIGQLLGAPEAPSSEGHFAGLKGITVSPVNGDVLVADGPQECGEGESECVVDMFEPAGGMPGVYNFLFAIKGPGEPFKSIGPIAVNGEGDIYVVEQGTNVVDQFDATGKLLTRLTGTPEGPFKELRSLAADPVSGNVYVGDFDREQHTGAIDAFGPSRIVPDVTTTGGQARVTIGAGGEGKIEATLNGTVDPLGQGQATCRFAWGASAAFGEFAPCQTSVPEGSGPAHVTASVTEGLAPDTHYLFRLQATNKNGTNPGEEADNKELITPGPGIHSQSASSVSATAATLNATIDPDGAPTSYYFQYGKSTAYEAQAPVTPGSLGAGIGDTQVPPQHIQGLSPETVYHYRVVAVPQLEVEGKLVAVSFPGPDQMFTTQGATGTEALPDGRRWELVSPPDKHGAVPLGVGLARAIQTASGGGAISYVTTIPTEEGVKGYIAGGVQVFAERGPAGWSGTDISLGHPTPVQSPVSLGQEYRLFSSDLSSALVEPLGEFNSLAGEAFPPDTERTPYVRHNFSCATAPGSCFQPLLLGCPPPGEACPAAVEEHADVPAGTKFGVGNPEGGGKLIGDATFKGASADLTHVVLASRVALTATPTSGVELYEVSPDRPASQELQLVSVVANEEGGEGPAEEQLVRLGFKDTIARHAISEDGSRVEFSSGPHLYLRDLAKGQTVQLDLPEEQCLGKEECGEGEASAHFQLASPDGSRVLFTDPQRLSSDAGRTPGEADLYQCEIEEVKGKLRCGLSDLTPAPGPHQAADVLGAVIGASEDGSWVYFVANGVLGDGAQHGASVGDCKVNGDLGEGQCNLYVSHEGVTHFIARLAGVDYPDWEGKQASELSRLTARVSPDGHYLAFMSQRPLTGYDNRDAVSDEADEEVFLYHAQNAITGSLVCASCDPSGARPVGAEAGKLGVNVIGFQVWPENTWIAANVPGWTPYEIGTALYQPRYLSNSGRLFFNSDDALVSQDINSNEDVYQYEPTSVGDCSGASATFHTALVGCVDLISSGRAAGESAFVDASESGNDVFFFTGERLVPHDVDTSLDLYDAHVCSGEAPCSEEAQSPPACTTADSCRAAPAPQPPIFGAPSSATFSGQGNLGPVGPPPAKPKAKAKPLTRAQKLAKALRACRKDKKRARRVSCEEQARKRYGPPMKKTKAKTNSHRGGK
jgi:hypothetical protein